MLNRKKLFKLSSEIHQSFTSVFLFLLSLVFILSLSCTPEEEIVTDSGNVRLTFSEDTIFFDTLFTTLGSTTQWLTIYNENKKAVEISSIELGKGNQSPYTLYVNGEEGSIFSNQLLLGGDSLLALIEVTIDPKDQDLPFLVKDSIVFRLNGNQQDVKLESWGQDAHFIHHLNITTDSTITANRPYVIYDSVTVQVGAILTIEPGARFYFEKNAGIVAHGSLNVLGTAENRVLFTNVRQDGAFENALGQWGGIFLDQESKGNIFNYTSIRNAEVGIYKESFLLSTSSDIHITLNNCIIENMNLGGLIAFNANIHATNTLIDNCAGYLVGNFSGGNYTYLQCTFANNNSNRQFIRQAPIIEFTDTTSNNESNLLQVVLKNNIIWGNMNDELVMDQVSENATFEIANNFIKSRISILAESNNVLNVDPEFIEPETFNYHLDTTSQAIDKGLKLGISLDLDGKSRDSLPDIGAYEFIKK